MQSCRNTQHIVSPVGSAGSRCCRCDRNSVDTCGKGGQPQAPHHSVRVLSSGMCHELPVLLHRAHGPQVCLHSDMAATLLLPNAYNMMHMTEALSPASGSPSGSKQARTHGALLACSCHALGMPIVLTWTPSLVSEQVINPGIRSHTKGYAYHAGSYDLSSACIRAGKGIRSTSN